MMPYPKNNINYEPTTPFYKKNTITKNNMSRYITYRVINNETKPVFEIKLTNAISNNSTFRGYYYTTTKYETLYEIAKKYYNDESLYWIIAKANQMKDNKLSSIKPNTTIIIPLLLELQQSGGYFQNV